MNNSHLDNELNDLRLRELGYEPRLNRTLKPWHVVGLAMADVSPTMSVLLLTAGVFSIGGTFAIGANIILGFVVVLISMNLAELGTLYPLAGGMYSLVKNVLPAPLTWITLFNYFIQGIIIPSSIALGIAQFLALLIPTVHISSLFVAGAFLGVGTIIAVTRVQIGSWVTTIMVIVELMVLTIITVGAILHPHQSLFRMMADPKLLVGKTLQPVGLGIMLATLAPAFNIINGYDASLGFSEEIQGGPKTLARVVIVSSILAVVLILVPLVAAMISVPNLIRFFSNPEPVVYAVTSSLGAGAGKLVDFGVIIALFNAMVSLLMYFSRVVYTSARDGYWGNNLGKKLSTVNRFKVPAWSVLFLSIPAFILMFFAALNWLIVFSGTVITVVYFFVGIAGLWSRIKDPQLSRPYRMPMWPLPSLVVIVVTGFAIATQEFQYLIGEIILSAIAIVTWAIKSYKQTPTVTLEVE